MVSVYGSLETYVEKLERRAPLSEADRSAFLSLPASFRRFEGQRETLTETRPTRCAFVIEGFVTREQLEGERRSIVAFGFPGDAVDLQSVFFETVDYSVVTHRATTLAYVAQTDIIAVIDRYPRLAKTLWHDCLVEAAIFRKWMSNIGHRPALARIAHLLLEYEQRLRCGVIEINSFEIALNQAALAASLGLSLVHLNKSLRRLQSGKLIEMRGRKIAILERKKLAELCQFDRGYLRFNSPPIFAERTMEGAVA